MEPSRHDSSHIFCTQTRSGKELPGPRATCFAHSRRRAGQVARVDNFPHVGEGGRVSLFPLKKLLVIRFQACRAEQRIGRTGTQRKVTDIRKILEKLNAGTEIGEAEKIKDIQYTY